MKLLSIFLGLTLILGCSDVGIKPNTPDLVRFTTQGGSYGDPRGVDYYVVVDDESAPNELKKKLMDYASYVLKYRGLSETLFPDDAEYILLVTFRPYNTKDNVQYFELAAASRKVYEVTKEFRPSWLAASLHAGKPTYPKSMLAMHTLAIRDFAGGNPSAYQARVSYESNSELVQYLIDKVEINNYVGN